MVHIITIDHVRSFTSNPPGIFLDLSVSSSTPSWPCSPTCSLARTLACMTIRRLFESRHGVVLGSGSKLPSGSSRTDGGGGAVLSLSMMEERRMSIMYWFSVQRPASVSSRKSDVFGASGASALALGDVVSELVADDSSERAVSYAMVVSNISRKMMRQSKKRTWNVEGGRPGLNCYS